MYEIVKITFEMNINNNGDKHTIQFNEIGKRYLKNNKTYIIFTEQLLEENKQNELMLICENNEITINRSGFINMKLSYKINEYTKGTYKNEYISTEIEAFTNKYQFNKNFIFLDYDIIVDKEKIGNYIMEINIKGVNGNE